MTQSEFADRIFLGGPILTMDETRPTVEAVAIRDGLILATGSETGVLQQRGPATIVTTLGEHALLPGFVDGHGHLSHVASGLGSVNLAGPPVGAVTGIEGLVAVLGAEQSITVEEALRAITIDAAYAHFEEDRKGSITPGKLADLVILGADPSRVALAEIQHIPVLETIKEGETIHGGRCKARP